MIDQAYFALSLRLHDAHQVGIGHGCERMVLHATFIQENGTCKQIAFEHGAAIVRKGGRGNGELAIQRVHQGFCDGADIACGGAVKSRAVFEINLLCALRFEPLQRFKRLCNGLAGRDGACFQSHHHGIHIGRKRCLGHAKCLHHPHARPDQVIGQVGGAGEVVCNATQFHVVSLFYLCLSSNCNSMDLEKADHLALGNSMPGKILITALSSSLAKPAVLACMNI